MLYGNNPKSSRSHGLLLHGVGNPRVWWHAVPNLGDPLFGGDAELGGGPGKDATMGYSTKVPIFSPSEPPAAAMDEWDLPQWKKEVESLKYQLAYKREMSSKTIPE